MSQFRRNAVVSASLFPLANDALCKIARYLDDGQARIGVEANDLRMTVAHLCEGLRCTLVPTHTRGYDCVEQFNQCDHKQFRSIDEIVGSKWPF